MGRRGGVYRRSHGPRGPLSLGREIGGCFVTLTYGCIRAQSTLGDPIAARHGSVLRLAGVRGLGLRRLEGEATPIIQIARAVPNC